MRGVLIALVVLQVLVPLGASAIEGKVLVELNTVEISEDRCRLNFVIENKFEQALDSMKLDLVVFSADGGIMRRFITEMAPLRPMKTVVRAFSVESRVLSDRRDLGERCDRLRAH
jgi:prephenate dehydrogenase